MVTAPLGEELESLKLSFTLEIVLWGLDPWELVYTNTDCLIPHFSMILAPLGKNWSLDALLHIGVCPVVNESLGIGLYQRQTGWRVALMDIDF